MPFIIKLMTLNINAITSDTKVKMLEGLLRQQEIDIVLLQETTTTKLNNTRGYNAIINDGTEKRGTAIMIREGITITDFKRIPSGRGKAVNHNGIRIINVYAPSGTEKRNERKYIFNTELPHILPTTTTDMIIAGDFKCIVDGTERTRSTNYSRALKKI
jgi:exonuclease III